MSFYDLQNVVSNIKGTFLVLDLTLTTRIGGWVKNPNNVKKYFILPKQDVP